MTRASLAVIDYANSLRVSADPAALIGNPPMVLLALPQLQYADGEDGEGKKRKKAKKLKDPNAPKRPPSAYIEFQNNVRQKFREQDPGLPYAEVLRKIADTWTSLDEEGKKPWNDIVAQKTIEYEQAKANYKPSGDIQVEEQTTTVGKDGKEYAGKKRGRKSNAEKAALGLSEPEITKAVQAASSTSKKSKKDKKTKEPTPVAATSDDEEDSSDEDEDEDDDSDDSSEAESEPQPKKSSKAKKEPPKHKKSKHA
ncbi:hypothetical protein OIV83_000570 [Microbotryomycetes sp. JL201]|nr:hypothetical protein OIV83_000570 [Microbotryomycetes sp. JL201]